MFRREAQQSEAVETATSTTVDIAEPAQGLPKAFQPSSFASRKAAADARNAVLAQPRIVSIGATEFTQRNTRTGAVEVRDATLYMDLDHPMERFIAIDGTVGLHPVGHDDQRRDEVTKLPPMRLRGHGPSALTTPAHPESPARPI